MTTPLLPDTDLARIAPLADDMKRAALRQMKTGFSTFSYKPIRSCFSEIFNVQPGMFAPVEPTPFDKINERLLRACKAGAEFDNNKKIAKALHDYATSHKVMGRHHDFFPMAMGMGGKVTFWLPMVLAIDGQPSTLFIDPRRNKGLNEPGRRFAFSMMHERIRAADEDFAHVNLGIMRFTEGEDGDRIARLHTDAGVKLHSLDELEAMVASTYRIWQEVHEERTAEARRKRAGGDGFL